MIDSQYGREHALLVYRSLQFKNRLEKLNRRWQEFNFLSKYKRRLFHIFIYLPSIFYFFFAVRQKRLSLSIQFHLTEFDIFNLILDSSDWSFILMGLNGPIQFI